MYKLDIVTANEMTQIVYRIALFEKIIECSSN